MGLQECQIIKFLSAKDKYAEMSKQLLVPTKCIVRVYIIEAFGLPPKDTGSDSDPYLVLKLGKKKIRAGITSFNAQFRAMYHLMSAGALIAALPPVAMFFLMQKHFIAGLTLGAVK